MAAATQAFQLPIYYTNNCVVSWASNTTLTVTTGQTRNSTNVADIVESSSSTINAAVNGVNGLDVGTFAASTWYYIFAIGSSLNNSVPAYLISASATAPTLPAGGYDVFSLVGTWVTDSSTHFVNGYVAGNGNVRDFFYDTPIQVITNGASATAVAVDVSAAVPPIQNTPVLLGATFSPATAGDYASFLPGDSTATPISNLPGSVAAKINGGEITVLSRIVTSVSKIKYVNSAASGSTNAWVKGFRFYI